MLSNRPKGSDSQGLILKEETVKIPIPSGVVDGMQLKVSAKGNDSPGNGICGDLLVVIQELPHDKLQREGDNLHYDLYISIPDAILGSSKDIDTVTGKVRIKIDAGLQYIINSATLELPPNYEPKNFKRITKILKNVFD